MREQQARSIKTTGRLSKSGLKLRRLPHPAWGHLSSKLGNALEQTDLCPVERAQYSALLDALRIEAGICQEVAALTYFVWANGSEPATFIGPTHPVPGNVHSRAA